MNNTKIRFGLDLGTTNSCLAMLDPKIGKAVVIPNLEALPTTPSAVYIQDGKTAVVGREALNRLAGPEAKNCVTCSKRQIAQDDKWSENGEFKGEYPIYNGQKLNPISAGALVAKKLIVENPNVTAVIGNAMPEVVVTIPAHFTNGARERTKQAVEAAGVKVISMIEEPVAAALSYHSGNDLRNRTVICFDHGGGTTDISVIRFDEKGKGVVTDKHGDPLLGGSDYDNAFGYYLWQKYCEKKPAKVAVTLDDFTADSIGDIAILRAVGKFRRLAQETKHALSSQEDYEVVLDDGDVIIPVARKEFEECVRPYVKAALDLVQSVFDDSRLAPADIDEVLLVGGSCIMPCVKASIEERFVGLSGKVKLADPHEAVAKGAAIYAGLCGEDGMDCPTAFQNCSTFSYGVLCVRDSEGVTAEEYVSNVIMKGSTLPAKAENRFSTYHPDQTKVKIAIYEDESKEEDVSLAEAREIASPEMNYLEFDKAVPKGTPLAISLELDSAGMLTVVGRSLVDSGRVHFQLHVSGTLDKKGVENVKRQIADGRTR